MDERRAREILDLVSEAYSDRGMPGIHEFVKTHPRDEGEMGLVLFCINEIGGINTKGSNTRLYCIDKNMRGEILSRYLALE